MGRRYDNEREYGNEGRNRYQDRGERGTSYRPGMSSFRGASDTDDDRYFGGSRQYGEGYSDSGSSQDWQDRDRGFRSSSESQDYSNRGSRNYRDDERRSSTQYTGYRGSDDFGSRDYGYGRGGVGSSYQGDNTGGMYGGGIGGYMGGGYQGYNPESYRGSSSSSRGYSSSYPDSESGYYSGRSGRENDRGWWERTSDEVSSWFGDDEARRRREMDQRTGSGHRGKGPKGYTRSDERIKEDVSDRLEDHYYLDASDIDVQVNGGDVVLTGTVDSRYSKRLAEDLVEGCSGVKNVENRIRVESNSSSRSSSTSIEDTLGTASTSSTQSRSATNR